MDLFVSGEPRKLHVPTVQWIFSNLLDIHVQESTGNEEQDVRGDIGVVQAWQRQVSLTIDIWSICCCLLFKKKKDHYIVDEIFCDYMRLLLFSLHCQ